MNDKELSAIKYSSASDIGIEYDKRYFKDDKLFMDLINQIQELKNI